MGEMIHIPARRKGGPESLYSEELADRICEEIADGNSLRMICERADMPNRSTVLRWLKEHAEFAAKYARAREDQSHLQYDLMMEIEAAALRGDVDSRAANTVLNNMRWRMMVTAPKAYGQRVAVTGAGGGAVQYQIVTGVPESEYEQRLREEREAIGVK